MKRLTILVLLLFSLQIFNVGAYDITVDSASEKTIVLAISDLNSIDIQLDNIVATVETQTISDRYTIDATLKKEGQMVLITVDVSPIFQDYAKEEVKAITVSGTVIIQGETIDFGKRVPYRSDSQRANLQLAPALDEGSSSLIYSIVGLSLLLVFLILILFYKKPKQKAILKKKTSVKKKKVVKKKTKKKAKKRL
ncbi:hypothetical protein EXS74_03835 [Candidatus Woesearchaeota archaeon]|nr:hypothetical protein [Candidatus Woesearchaeota archaeon]